MEREQGIPHSIATRIPTRRVDGAVGESAVIRPADSCPRHIGCWRVNVPLRPCA